MKLSVPIDRREEIISWFLANIDAFVVRSTSYSLTVKSDSHRVCLTDSAIGYAVLGLMSKVKSDASKIIENIPDNGGFKRPTHAMKPIIDLNKITIYEYDKNAAYANAALDGGVISQETFKKIMSIDKRFRLSILGSLASRPTIENYFEGKRVSIETKDNPHRKAWDYICNLVSEEMNDLFLSNNHIFAYWVDAVYSFTPIHTLKGYKPKVVVADIRTDGGLRLFIGGEQHLFIPYPPHIRTNPRTKYNDLPLKGRL